MAMENGDEQQGLEMRPNPVATHVLSPQSMQEAGRTKKQEQLKPKVSFCTSVGWDGMLTLCCMYAVSGAQLWIAYQYTGLFRSFNRWPVFFFFICHAAYFLTPTYMLCRWRALFTSYESQHWNDRESDIDDIVTNLCQSLQHTYRSTYIHRPRFLWKFYASEFIGFMIQAFNLRTILLCSVPGWTSALIAILFSFEAAYSAFVIRQTFTSTLRDRMVKTDALTDAVDTIIPLAAMYSFGIGIPLSDMLQLVAWTSFTMLGKLRSIFREVLRKRSSDRVWRARSFRKGGQKQTGVSELERESMTNFEMVALAQSTAIPRTWKLFISWILLFYSTWMVCLAGWVLIADSIGREKCRGVNDGEYIWERCTVKSPLCKEFFAPRCDCAVVAIHKHNMTSLPDVLASMHALRRVEVTDGTLKNLPDNFGSNAKNLAMVVLDFNELTALPETFGRMSSLHTMYAAFNRLENVPKNFWKLQELYKVDFGTNRIGEAFEDAAINLPNLHFLTLANNSISKFPPAWHEKNMGCPSLVILDVSGNDLRSLPRGIESLKYLETIYFARNKVNSSSLPHAMAATTLLRKIDARNNSLTHMPYWFSNVHDLYMSGNPFCNQIPKPDICAEQCSAYCNSADLLNYGCDLSCNVLDCNYDNNQCK